MMKKVTNSWMFSFIFFVFLSSFLVVKAIFILFFQASFDPLFILQLTPLYLLPSINNMQLFLFSLIVVVVDGYLHIKDTRRNLLYSLIPTMVMLSGVSTVIIINEFSVEYTVQYILFLLLLTILVVDHKRTLNTLQLKFKQPKKMGQLKTKIFPLPSLAFIQPFSTKQVKFKFKNKHSKREQEIEILLNERIKNKKYTTMEKKTLLPKVEMMSDLCRLEEMTPSYANVLIDAGFKSLKEVADGDPRSILKVFSGKENLLNAEVTMEQVERWVDSAKTLIEQENSGYWVNSPKYLNRE